MVSILIPTRNAGPRFAETLKAIREQRTSRRFELVVVDSGSSDGTVELAAASGAKVHTIPPQDFGHGRTRNLLAHLAQGESLVFVTQDALPANDRWLDRLLVGLDDPKVAACFGRQLPRPGASLLQTHHLAWWYPDRPMRWSLEHHGEARINRLFYSHVNAVCRRAIWQTVPFDENIVMSEDQAWSRRALLTGWDIVYEPSAAVIHSHDFGMGRAFRRHFDSGASLTMITIDSGSDWFSLGLGYLASELRFLVSHGASQMVPYAVAFEAARYSGFEFGRRQRHLPVWLKRRLSEHAAYWAAAAPSQGPRREDELVGEHRLPP